MISLDLWSADSQLACSPSILKHSNTPFKRWHTFAFSNANLRGTEKSHESSNCSRLARPSARLRRPLAIAVILASSVLLTSSVSLLLCTSLSPTLYFSLTDSLKFSGKSAGGWRLASDRPPDAASPAFSAGQKLTVNYEDSHFYE